MYSVLIKASNDVDEKEIKCIVIVEDRIADLSLSVPPPRIKDGSKLIYIAVGETISMEGHIVNGTGVSCSFDFGEEKVKKDVDVFKTSYTYEQMGNYTVGLTCKNRVSSAHREHSTRIVIQKDEEITNLTIVVDVTRKGNPSVFTLVKSTGTAFVCDWTLGDGTTFQTDISDIGVPVFHLYTEEGPFEVSVRCRNRHGVVEAKTVAWVQIPITGLTCDSLQTYVNTSEDVSFNISINSGSHVTILAEFERKQSLSVSFKEGFNDRRYFILRHSFTSNGSYEVKVTASNRLGMLATRCKPVVVVQNPLRNIILTSDKIIMKVLDEVEFDLKISAFDELLPTDASCSWSFGDGSPVHHRQMLFNINRRDIMRHRYLSEGKFRTHVWCSNQVSRISLDTAVTVLEPVSPVMKACLHCDHSTSIREISSREYFSLGDKVTFLVTAQDFDRTYRWMMTRHGDLAVTKEPYLNTILNKTGTFSVTVVVDKVVENMSTLVQFVVQEKISGVSFTSNGFTWLRSSTHFEVILPKFHYGNCFVIYFSDSFNSKNNITDCAASTDVSGNFVLSFNRTFLREGNYSVCLAVFNKVSEEKRCLLIEVAKPVCKIKNISIWASNRKVSGKIEDPLQTLKYNKSRPFQLEGRFINGCLLPGSKDFKLAWKVERIISESSSLETGSDLEASELVWESEDSLITVHARTLEYGRYYFVFSAELTTADVRNLYGQVLGKTVVKVEIVRSPITGNIDGKKFQEVDIEEKLRLDALFYDPDLPPRSGQIDMKFDWYCKTQVQANGPFVHCFDEGKSYDTFPITSLTSPTFITSLDRYVANKTYIFSVKVLKEGDGRTAWGEVAVFILPPGPPKMSIR